MYDPLQPNSYRNAKLDARRRQRPASPAVQPDFLADALASISDGGAPAMSAPPHRALAAAPVPVSASAEELHELRVSRSAAMGIGSAIAMEKDALLVAHRQRRLEGADAKSRIAGMLSRMRAPASSEGTQEGRESAPTPSPAPSAPLVFRPSHLAAGGYVMATDSSGVGGGAASVVGAAAMGKPSSALLLRWARQSPVPPEMAGGPAQATAALIGAQARAECGRYGVVRSSATHVLTSEEESRVRERMPDDSAVESAMAHERFRVLVRFDTVTDAFKAAEELRKSSNWCVVFFPTASYDAGKYGPTDGESLCE